MRYQKKKMLLISIGLGTIIGLVFIICMVFTICGCSDDDDDDFTPTPTPTKTPTPAITPQPPVEPHWRMWRHDYRHTGYAPYPGPKTPTIKWINDEFNPKYVVVDEEGFIYVSAQIGTYPDAQDLLACLYPDGNTMWTYYFPESFYWFALPLIGFDGKPYALDSFGRLYCFDRSGNLLWSRKYIDDDQQVISSPTQSPTGDIIFTTWYGEIFSISPSGDLNWRIIHDLSGIYCSPAVAADGTIYYVVHNEGYENDSTSTHSKNDYLIARDKDGIFKWLYGFSFCATDSICIDDEGMIYLECNSSLYKISPYGNLMWETPVIEYGGILYSAPAISPNGYLVIGTRIGDVLYLSTDDGSIKWIFHSLGYKEINSSPVITTDDLIYFYGDSDYDNELHLLFVLNNNGELIWQYEQNAPYFISPVIMDDGTLLFPAQDKLIAFKD